MLSNFFNTLKSVFSNFNFQNPYNAKPAYIVTKADGSKVVVAGDILQFSAHDDEHGHSHENHGGGYIHDDSDGNGMGVMKSILIALLILAGIWLLFTKGCNGSSEGAGHGEATHTEATHDANAHKTTETTTTAASHEVHGTFDSVKNEFIYDAGKMMTIDLPNGGGKLEVGQYSTEYQLFQFLNDANAQLDTVKGNWFEFTNVKFKTGSTEITEESMTQLKNFIAISKAFPNSKFKVGGYTDNSGDAAKNVALSQKRADAVAAKIVSMGAAATSLTGAKGFGSEHPLSSNDTPEGRAQNRRVAVNVKAK